MRSDKEIDREIKKLEKALAIPDRWNDAGAKELRETIKVLRERMPVIKVEREYYSDESAEDFEPKDNDLWAELDLAARWLRGDTGYNAPSKGL
jgi:hypothetical protein